MRLLEKVTIRLPLGLNLRSSAHLVQIANRFRCGITLQNGTDRADARSLLGLLTLAAMPGSELSVYFDGEDAQRASREIHQFFTLERAKPEAVNVLKEASDEK